MVWYCSLDERFSRTLFRLFNSLIIVRLRMDRLSANTVGVFIPVFVVLFSGGLVHRVEGQGIIQVANRGDNITLSCYLPIGINQYCWYKDGNVFAYVGQTDNDDSRFTQSFNSYYSQSKSQYNLTLTNVNYADSATYQCYYGNDACRTPGKGYNLRVINGCSCIVTDHMNPEYGKVVCELSPSVPRVIRYIPVTINKVIQTLAAIIGNAFSFSIYRSTSSNLKVELSPYDNVIRNIVCTVPTQLTSPHPSTHFHTSLPTLTTRDRRSAVSSTASPTASPTASEEFTVDAPTKHHTPPNEISSIDNSTGTGYTTLIIVIIGSLFLLVLIVIIIVVICKKTKNRHKSKPNRNVSIDNQVVNEEVPEHAEGDYEPIEDKSRKEPEYTNSIEMLRKGNKDGKDADYLSIDVSTANVPHDYMALIPTSSRSTESETTDNQTCDMAEYVNSSIRDQPKWKGVSPQPEDQYDDVSVPEIRDDDDDEEDLVYSDIQQKIMRIVSCT